MTVVAQVLVGLVALLHSWFLVLEMFLWTTPTGRRTFGLERDFAEQTRTLAANQGLYNGFLAAGLIWGLLYRDRRVGRHIQLFFLGCVAVAGVYGAYSAKFSILFVQALPAAIAGSLVVLVRSRAENSAA